MDDLPQLCDKYRTNRAKKCPRDSGRACGGRASKYSPPLPAAFDYDLCLWRTSAPATIILAIRNADGGVVKNVHSVVPMRTIARDAQLSNHRDSGSDVNHKGHDSIP